MCHLAPLLALLTLESGRPTAVEICDVKKYIAFILSAATAGEIGVRARRLPPCVTEANKISE